jgi:uncharacterized protein (TIGR03437 family)
MKILNSSMVGAVLGVALTAFAQPPLTIKSFSVGPDQTLTYPNNPANPPYLVDLPDEHTTVIPPAAAGGPYLVFAASKLSGGSGGAVVLQSTDLTNFNFATSLGYNRQVFAPPTPIDQCNPLYTTEFDGNYAAPGSVVQDPTLPPGNVIIIYEAENHCPGGMYNPEFYATVGFARSSDNGKTWPAPVNGPMGGPNRHPVLQSSIPQPSTSHPPEGDAIPSAFADTNANGDSYLYVTYGDHTGVPSDNLLRVARAKLGADPLVFSKWNQGAFSQPGISGSDSGVTPSAGCPNGRQAMGEISRNDGLGAYLMIFVCVSGGQGSPVGAWYYSTATSLDLQDWSVPQIIQNSQFPVTMPCSADGRGQQFDGWYPSSMSPGAPAGHTKLTGLIFYHNGCDTGKRVFMSRTFTITAGPASPVLNAGSVANAATYFAGGLVPGSWAQVKGTNLANTTRVWASSDFTGLGNNLPTNLSGTDVMVNNVLAAVYYISPTQISFQVPTGVSGTPTVQVINNGMASNTVTAAPATNSPGIFPIIVNGTNYAAAVFLDGKIAGDPSISPLFRNAKPGEVVSLFATGLVPTTAGVLPSLQLVSGVTVTIGDITVPADFAGLVAVGEFQINFTLPQQFANIPAGNYPITITVNEVSSPSTINSNPPAQLVLPIQH